MMYLFSHNVVKGGRERTNPPSTQNRWAAHPSHCPAVAWTLSARLTHVELVGCVGGGGGGENGAAVTGAGVAPPPVPAGAHELPTHELEQQSSLTTQILLSGLQKHVPTPFSLRQRPEQQLKVTA